MSSVTFCKEPKGHVPSTPRQHSLQRAAIGGEFGNVWFCSIRIANTALPTRVRRQSEQLQQRHWRNKTPNIVTAVFRAQWLACCVHAFVMHWFGAAKFRVLQPAVERHFDWHCSKEAWKLPAPDCSWPTRSDAGDRFTARPAPPTVWRHRTAIAYGAWERSDRWRQS